MFIFILLLLLIFIFSVFGQRNVKQIVLSWFIIYHVLLQFLKITISISKIQLQPSIDF